MRKPARGTGDESDIANLPRSCQIVLNLAESICQLKIHGKSCKFLSDLVKFCGILPNPVKTYPIQPDLAKPAKSCPIATNLFIYGPNFPNLSPNSAQPFRILSNLIKYLPRPVKSGQILPICAKSCQVVANIGVSCHI